MNPSHTNPCHTSNLSLLLPPIINDTLGFFKLGHDLIRVEIPLRLAVTDKDIKRFRISILHLPDVFIADMPEAVGIRSFGIICECLSGKRDSIGNHRPKILLVHW